MDYSKKTKKRIICVGTNLSLFLFQNIMRRKILHISIVIILTIATTGISISKHFCGDRLVEVSVNEKSSPCCGTESNCCQTETDFFQLEDDFTETVTTGISNCSKYYLDYATNADHFISNNPHITSSKTISSDSSPPLLRISDLSFQQTYLL